MAANATNELFEINLAIIIVSLAYLHLL
jgi:hypothetical protein